MAVLTHDARALVETFAVPVNPDTPKERLTFNQGARRFRAPEPPAGVAPRRRGQPESVIDRVDALALVMRAAGVPRAQTLVENAHAVLGHVFRDAAMLTALLREPPHGDASDRRAVIVARRPLGSVPDFALAVPDAGDPLDMRAYVVACVLADLAGAVVRVTTAYHRAQRTAREVTDIALQGAENGLLLTVIG